MFWFGLGLNMFWWPHLHSAELCQPVTSHNTHITIADKFLPVLDPRNHPYHLHMTSEIPRNKFLHLDLVVINSQPWTLPTCSLSLVSCFSLTMLSCVSYSC